MKKARLREYFTWPRSHSCGQDETRVQKKEICSRDQAYEQYLNPPFRNGKQTGNSDQLIFLMFLLGMWRRCWRVCTQNMKMPPLYFMCYMLLIPISQSNLLPLLKMNKNRKENSNVVCTGIPFSSVIPEG